MNDPRSVTATTAPALPQGDPCRATPGCVGRVLDGYCTVCGKRAVSPVLPELQDASRSDSLPSPGTSRATFAGTWRSSTATHTSRSRGGSGLTTRTSTTVLPRSRIGAGLVVVPPTPPIDPTAAIMPNPVVAESKRFCSRCGAPVGRSRDGREGRLSGFCSKCRHPYSFVPALQPGELVAGQYRIAGCLAYGGLGWVYLAQDEQVNNRWVVLKGLLNAHDADATAAAIVERRFLASVEHPNIVRIYNFVVHQGAGYTVMEYVGGKSLKTVLKERREAAGKPDPLPLEHAIAYILAILPAFGYLHRMGLAYNDFKPDNLMLQGDDVKLIDLGAVTRLDEPQAVIYGTDGFQAPEVAKEGCSPVSDLYAIGRCLAVLTLDFPGYQTKYQYTLPPYEETPLFQEHESFYRFLLKATALKPEDRFQSAEDMAEQLMNVLREVVARREGVPAPAPSSLFGQDMQTLWGGPPEQPDWHHLPIPRVDPADASAALVLNAMALGEPAQQVAWLRQALAQNQAEATIECELGLARALIELGRFDEAEASLSRVWAMAPKDWRVNWYRGLAALAQGQPGAARDAFDRVVSDLPGELAPKLALALACELDGELASAGRLYEVVVQTDPTYTSACFGLARIRLAQGDAAGAVEAYRAIPPHSSLHTPAQVLIARTLLRGERGRPPQVEDLVRAAETIERLPLDQQRRLELMVDLFDGALRTLEAGGVDRNGTSLLGYPLEERSIGFALERVYRDLARLAEGPQKIWLVDRANQVRPWTAA